MNIAQNLCDRAIETAKNAYAPYSGFKVGAALLCADGTIYTGCNIENSSYSAAICAERVAFSKAISESKNDFIAIAVAGGREAIGESVCPPCGICRQFISEFCNPDSFKIILPQKDGFEEYLLSDLLPHTFTLDKTL